jgi:hypothetical protein
MLVTEFALCLAVGLVSVSEHTEFATRPTMLRWQSQVAQARDRQSQVAQARDRVCLVSRRRPLLGE